MTAGPEECSMRCYEETTSTSLLLRDLVARSMFLPMVRSLLTAASCSESLSLSTELSQATRVLHGAHDGKLFRHTACFYVV